MSTIYLIITKQTIEISFLKLYESARRQRLKVSLDETKTFNLILIWSKWVQVDCRQGFLTRELKFWIKWNFKKIINENEIKRMIVISFFFAVFNFSLFILRKWIPWLHISDLSFFLGSIILYAHNEKCSTSWMNPNFIRLFLKD